MKKVKNTDAADDKFLLLQQFLQKKESAVLNGVAGSFFSFLISMCVKKTKAPFFVITDTHSRAEDIVYDLRTFGCEDSFYLPPQEFSDEGNTVTADNLSERFFIFEKMLQGCKNPVVVTPVKTMLERTLLPEKYEQMMYSVEVGQKIVLRSMISFFLEAGYERVDMVQIRGEFSMRGGIVDIYPLTCENPVRIEFFDDEIESIRFFNPETQVSEKKTDKALISPAKEFAFVDDKNHASVFDFFKEQPFVFFSDLKDIKQKADKEQEFAFNETLTDVGEMMQEFGSCVKYFASSIVQSDEFFPEEMLNFEYLLFKDMLYENMNLSERKEKAIEKIKEFLRNGNDVVIVCNNEGEKDRLGELLNIKNKKLKFVYGRIKEGFYVPDLQLLMLSDQEIFSRYKIRRNKRTFSHGFSMKQINKLKNGDYVVHASYGIGRFRGVQVLNQDGQDGEVLVVEYEDRAKLYVPLEQISLIEKYIGIKGKPPKLNKLGSGAWLKTKKKINNEMADMAAELLQMQAERKYLDRASFEQDSAWQYEFEKSFIYEETADQLKAIADVKNDMLQNKPMDRLICGDVGFGKTEVAIRAAFKTVSSGYQVAVLVPTTVLALQHYNSFCERMADYPVKIEMLSRFKTKKEQKEILEALKKGDVDIVIGTHRIVQPDIFFKNIGLLIVDEEQRFGVKHKYMLKKMRKTVDVLTMSATPIPRTLHMALGGVKDMSVIMTPPGDRLPIETIISEHKDEVIIKAVRRELERDGQIFFVHNRVVTIEKVKEKLQKILPDIRIATAHGQMHEDELGFIMEAFINGKIDMLVCTTIIESGIDIPNANTIIIDRADHFGLSQLYQLRGRVGRSKVRAYAYLLVSKDKIVAQDAKKRLKAIHQYTKLGSGFDIAMRDLEIRGAGNILGKDQHGHIYAIGLDLYCKLLKACIKGVKENKEAGIDLIDPKMSLPFAVQFSLEYIPDLQQRLDIYRRLNNSITEEEVKKIREELIDRFGRMDEKGYMVIEKALIKIWLKERDISSLEIKNHRIVLYWQEEKYIFQLDKTTSAEKNNLKYLRGIKNFLKSLQI